MCAAVLQDINKRFFAACKQNNNLVPRRDRFFDFDLSHATEPVKSKIVVFSKTPQWISMKIKLRGHFSISFQLKIPKARKSKFEKVDFLKILSSRKNRQILLPIFKFLINGGENIVKTDFFRWFSANSIKHFSRNR